MGNCAASKHAASQDSSVIDTKLSNFASVRRNLLIGFWRAPVFYRPSGGIAKGGSCTFGFEHACTFWRPSCSTFRIVQGSGAPAHA